MKLACVALGVAVLMAASGTWAASDESEAGVLSPFEISPFIGGAAAYDSNIDRASADEEDLFYGETVAGLRLGYRSHPVTASGLAFLGRRFHMDSDRDDYWTGGEALSFGIGSPDRLAFALQQSYREVQDTDAYAAEAQVGGLSSVSFLDADARSQRAILEGGASLDSEPTDAIGLSAGYRYSSTDYDRADLLDLTGHSGLLEVSHRLTDKTAVLLAGVGEIQKSATVASSDYLAGRVGIKTRGTDRVIFKLGLGAHRLSRTAGDDLDGFNYEGGLTWRATERTLWALNGRNGQQVSSIHRGNLVDFAAFRVGVLCRMSSSLSLSANGLYRLDDYADPIAVDGRLVDREDRGATLKLRADYTLPSGHLTLFGETSHEWIDSTVRDYDVTIVNLGAQVQL